MSLQGDLYNLFPMPPKLKTELKFWKNRGEKMSEKDIRWKQRFQNFEKAYMWGYRGRTQLLNLILVPYRPPNCAWSRNNETEKV